LTYVESGSEDFVSIFISSRKSRSRPYNRVWGLFTF
jgi:hypothetical protein